MKYLKPDAHRIDWQNKKDRPGFERFQASSIGGKNNAR